MCFYHFDLRFPAIGPYVELRCSLTTGLTKLSGWRRLRGLAFTLELRSDKQPFHWKTAGKCGVVLHYSTTLHFQI